jgi:hypothetical protein
MMGLVDSTEVVGLVMHTLGCCVLFFGLLCCIPLAVRNWVEFRDWRRQYCGERCAPVGRWPMGFRPYPRKL